MAARPGGGPIPASIMLVGEHWGAEEERLGEAFVGGSGFELNKMLHEAGLMRSECYCTNVVNARPPGDSTAAWMPKTLKEIRRDYHVPLHDRWVDPRLWEGYQSLLAEINLVKPRIIVALGGVALWALTKNWGIMKWRGSLLEFEGRRLIPTYNPAAVLHQWEWHNIVVHDLRRVKRFLDGAEPPPPAWRFIVRPSFQQVMERFDGLEATLEHEAELWLDFDLETRAGHIACAGISWNATQALSIPFMCVENKDGYWNADEEAFIVWRLWKVLTHPRVKVRWQNGLYDAQYTFRHWHFIPRGAQDTMISHHTAFAGLPKRLDFQASMYCGHYVYWKDDGKTWNKGMGEEQLWAYNCVDCVRTREVGEASASAVKGLGLTEIDAFQQRLFWPVLKAMTRGVLIDRRARDALAGELFEEISERDRFFAEVLGHPLNVRSSPQMCKLFYEDLGQRPIVSRPTKHSAAHVTCNDEALELLKEREPLLRPIIRRIQEQRSLGVFLSTFARAPLDTDGRMRCSYNICGTETYRLSSSENAFGSGTNLQNIPKGGEEDDSDLKLPNIRKVFIPDPGFTIFDTDLSKADLRIVVWESDERELKAMLAEGRDPYVEIAREFYRDPSITKSLPNGDDHPKYRIFKSFCHGSNYLGSPRGLAQRLALTVHESERTQRWYFGKFPRIPQWQERLKQQLLRTHKVTNRFGYTRHYFERIDQGVFRKAAAWIPQSSIAILINKIWLAVYDNLPEVEVLLQVHDSLVGQFPRHLRDWAVRRIKEEASAIVIPYEDPLVIPVGVKTSEKSWGDCA